MRLALIGCGQVVERYHLPALASLPEIQVSCIVDTSRERLDVFCARLPGTPAYENLNEALAASAADAALIATPPATHANLARRCLAGGWHVLIEKPMATSLADARSIVAEASRVNRHVAVGFNRKFRRSWATARRLLANSDPNGWQDASLILAFDTTRWRAAASLATEAASLSSLLDDVVPHQADLLAFLLDQPIVRLRAEQVRFRSGHSIALTYMAQLRDGRSIRCRAEHMPGHREQLKARVNHRTLDVTPRTAIWEGRMPIVRRRCSTGWGKLVDAADRVLGRPSATVASFGSQYRAFQSMLQGASPGDLADGDAGAAACAVGDALRASIAGSGTEWTAVEGMR